MSIDVRSKVKVYEVNGEDTPPLDKTTIEVESHWVYSDRVTLVVGRKRYTVIVHDLMDAITNATRTGSR